MTPPPTLPLPLPSDAPRSPAPDCDLPLFAAADAFVAALSKPAVDRTLPPGFHYLNDRTRKAIYCEHCGGMRTGKAPAALHRETAKHQHVHVVGEVMKYRFGRGQVPIPKGLDAYLRAHHGLQGEHDQWGMDTLKAIRHQPTPAADFATNGAEVCSYLPWGLWWFERHDLDAVLPSLSTGAVATRRHLRLLLPALELHRVAAGAPWWLCVLAALVEFGPHRRAGIFRGLRVHNVYRGRGGRVVRDPVGRALTTVPLPSELIERASGSRWTKDPTLRARYAEHRAVTLPAGDGDAGGVTRFSNEMVVDQVDEDVLPPWLRPLSLRLFDDASPDLQERLMTLRGVVRRAVESGPLADYIEATADTVAEKEPKADPRFAGDEERAEGAAAERAAERLGEFWNGEGEWSTDGDQP